MITPSKVHSIIKQMVNITPVNAPSVYVKAVADELHVTIDDLLIHLNTLHDLYYLEFADRANKK